MKKFFLALTFVACACASPLIPYVDYVTPSQLGPNTNILAADVRFPDPVTQVNAYEFTDFAIDSTLGYFSWTLPSFQVQDMDFGGSYTFLVPFADFAFYAGVSNVTEVDTITMTEYGLGAGASPQGVTYSFQVFVAAPDPVGEPPYFLAVAVCLIAVGLVRFWRQSRCS